MSPLTIAACVLGGIHLLGGILAIAAPSACCRAVKAFPRSSVAAWVLTGADLAWVASIVLTASLGRFEFLKPWMYVAAPVAFFVLVFLLDELLAARALGGLLLLAGDPLLDAARWHDSGLRLVVTVLAYVWIVVGMLFVLSPYYFRRIAVPCVKTDAACRRFGLLAVVLGAVLLVLGLTVY